MRTGPYTAVRRVELKSNDQRQKTERNEVSIGQGDSESGRVTEPPRAMCAAGCLRSQRFANAPLAKLSKPRLPAPPLLPDDRAQPSSDPLLKALQHRRRLAESEVPTPPNQIATELLDHRLDTHASRSARQLSHSLLETLQSLRRNSPPWLALPSEAKLSSSRCSGVGVVIRRSLICRPRVVGNTMSALCSVESKAMAWAGDCCNPRRRSKCFNVTHSIFGFSLVIRGHGDLRN